MKSQSWEKGFWEMDTGHLWELELGATPGFLLNFQLKHCLVASQPRSGSLLDTKARASWMLEELRQVQATEAPQATSNFI